MQILCISLFTSLTVAWVVPAAQTVLVDDSSLVSSSDHLHLHDSEVKDTRSALSDSTGVLPADHFNFHASPSEERHINLEDEYFDLEAWLSPNDEFSNEEEQGSEVILRALESERSTSIHLDGIKDVEDGRYNRDDHSHHGHHGHHDHPKPNMTVYQLIASSNYTKTFTKLINEYDDLVDFLNGTSTSANITVFAPTDHAFSKIPESAPKPSKELLQRILSYHVSPDYFPAGRILTLHTIPTLLSGTHLSNKPEQTPQRLSTNIGLRGLTVNFYSRVVAIDIFGTNGVIHGVDSILVPPPKAAAIIQFLPSEFSTLELGLLKTGLFPALNDTSNHLGGTLFAPSNFAFQKLGPRANAFLFSQYGQKYLKALLEYHIVANQTLYSDAFYKNEVSEKIDIPKGLFHVDLPTLLRDRHLSIDIFRYGRYISIKINGFASVTVSDGIAKDGVIHTISSILIPPKQVDGDSLMWQGGEISEQDLQERLEPYLTYSL